MYVKKKKMIRIHDPLTIFFFKLKQLYLAGFPGLPDPAPSYVLIWKKKKGWCPLTLFRVVKKKKKKAYSYIGKDGVDTNPSTRLAPDTPESNTLASIFTDFLFCVRVSQDRNFCQTVDNAIKLSTNWEGNFKTTWKMQHSKGARREEK